jgi:dipeptidyl aminopeptidase/acylaminoacyl peptidase
MRSALVVFLLLAPIFCTCAWAARPMTVDDLLAVKAVSDPQVSPDGQWVVYVVGEIDREAGKTNSDLWLVPAAGGEPKRLTTATGADNHPRWSPDGKTIAFTSSRGGSTQVWLLPLDGGEARALTKLPIDVSGPIWSPRGDRIAFAAEVYPGKTPEETAKTDKEKEESRSKARIFDSLMIRHWDKWDEGKRSHLFVADASTGEARDLTPRLDVNTPPGPFGGSNDYSFSPDGQELAFTAEPLEDAAWSTNTDIWTVPVGGGEPRNITAANKGADAQPAYSPDGHWIAYLSQARAGFESDSWVLKLYGRKATAQSSLPLSEHLDRPVQSFAWCPSWDSETRSSSSLIGSIDDSGGISLVSLGGFLQQAGNVRTIIPAKTTRRTVTGGVNTAAQVVPDSGALVFLHADAAHPGEVFTAKRDGSEMRPLTHHNAPLLASLDLTPAEGFTFAGAGGDSVAGWLIRPPGFDPKKKYPVLLLIHGGPQGAWHDEWHNRWNYGLFAAPGYVVVAINPRGSTGYGQKFTDQISKDWTGRVYEDLMKGLDHALGTYPFLDADRVGALGGSYGGFMVNWIAGHTDRFRALISHAGVFDLTSKYGTTEELWFPEWEFGGTPWEQPEHYRERSPSQYVANFKTPTLIIHGALDFRVPDAQGLGMFTALQRRGVPSRYVFFPDEGHWILKPANRVVWWREVHAWLDRYLKAKSDRSEAAPGRE